ncbi:MAG: hypothetical protein HY985_08910 [Magnetospirillum sp.]|nr:hypothetical protein [Magnetospirillum sp.]
MPAPRDSLTLPLAGERLRWWLLLAVGALAAAGVLALLLVLSRTPTVQDWLPWGSAFFHRALVVHVVLSFQVWFLALFGAVAGGGRTALVLSTGGAVLLILPALADRGEPSLNNYVPVLDHPLFFAGLALTAAGAALAALRAVPLLRSPEPLPFAIASAGATVLAALLCFALAGWQIPAATDPAQRYERLFWGGGHVLQILNTMLLMIAWHWLAERRFGRAPLPPPLTRAVFAALLAFAAAAPLIYARTDVPRLAHRQAFTALLWLGLPLPPLVMGGGLARLLWQRRGEPSSAATLAVALSLLVFGLGGIAGFFLGVADTRTPSHYHAMIGGVNLAVMGLILTVFLPRTAKARLSLHLYGWGQVLHALGFFLAGAAGVPRKTAGLDQGLDSVGKLAAMGVVGVGGAIAVLGGVIFVATVLTRLLQREDGDERA